MEALEFAGDFEEARKMMGIELRLNKGKFPKMDGYMKDATGPQEKCSLKFETISHS